MTGSIASSTGAAQHAVASMTDGLTVANQLLDDIGSLADCVWSQASKFPKIAETLANKDSQAAHQFGGTVY